MKTQGTKRPGNQGTRDLGIAASQHRLPGTAGGNERTRRLLREALPAIGEGPGPTEDLWPAMARRLRTEWAAGPVKMRIPWFDWALAGVLALLLAAFPAAIPVLLYYL